MGGGVRGGAREGGGGPARVGRDSRGQALERAHREGGARARGRQAHDVRAVLARHREHQSGAGEMELRQPPRAMGLGLGCRDPQ
ncbi:hypothetical protein ACS47_00170 [Bacillus cereus]|nr:hypothetical protein ACS47_00170 [Bacillus cereus]